MSNRTRYILEEYLQDITNACHYSLAKGNKPNDDAVCTNQWRSYTPFNSGFTNKQLLEDCNFVQVPRVKSRFRVSPSPRKIPSYTLDNMALELLSKMAVDVRYPWEMMLQQQHEIRRTLPRFR